MGDFHLQRPEILYALLAWPVFLLWRLRTVRNRALPLAPLQFRPPGRLARHLPDLAVGLEALALGLAVLALAGPATRVESRQATAEGVDVALVLDISASMQAADFPPNRLECLKTLAKDFIRRSGSDRIGIFAFAGDCFTQSPFTTDHAVLAELVDGLSFRSISHTAGGGTAIGDALVTAAEALARVRVKGRAQALVLVTDGQSNTGLDPGVGVRYLREKGIRFYAIGVGGPVPVKVWVEGRPFINTRDQQLETYLDDAELRKLAALAHGRFARATDAGMLQGILADLARMESGPLQVRTSVRDESAAGWAALAALAAFGLWWAAWGFGVRCPFR